MWLAMGGNIKDTGLSNGSRTPVEGKETESSMTMDRFAGLELRLDTPKGTAPLALLLLSSSRLLHVLSYAVAPDRCSWVHFSVFHNHNSRITPGRLPPFLCNPRKVYYLSCGGTVLE